jgi:hypothetical protein
MDRLFAEVDRQLEHVRSQTDAVAMRSGFLIATTAVAASVLAARIQTGKLNVAGPLAALGLAAVLGLGALAPLLKTGPKVLALKDWSEKGSNVDRATAVTQLFQAKLELLDANRQRLSYMIIALILQGGAVTLAVVLALVSTVER